MPLYGPRGRGTLHARALFDAESAADHGGERAGGGPAVDGPAGSWVPVLLLLELPGGDMLDLLQGGKAVEVGAISLSTDSPGGHPGGSLPGAPPTR